MTDPRKPIFDAVRAAAPPCLFNDAGNVLALDNLLDAFGVPRDEAKDSVTDLTPAIVLEVIEHEGIVPEAYKDSVGVWTWGVGVTDASGHSVGRYKDNPQTIAKCLEIYLWLLREKYLPAVLAAFEGRPLSENELGAALSFHWNTGAIGQADWVKDVLRGDMAAARASILNWRSPPEILSRRTSERDLFFDGRWVSDGKVSVWGVSKPSYKPSGAKLVAITNELEALL